MWKSTDGYCSSVGQNSTYGLWESAVRMWKSTDGLQYNEDGHGKGRQEMTIQVHETNSTY